MDTQAQDTLTQAVSLGGISSLASASALILTADHFTWRGFVRANVLALFVAVVCYEGLKDARIGDGLKFVVTAAGAVCAEYVIRATLSVARAATSKPVDLFIKLIRG